MSDRMTKRDCEGCVYADIDVCPKNQKRLGLFGICRYRDTGGKIKEKYRPSSVDLSNIGDSYPTGMLRQGYFRPSRGGSSSGGGHPWD